MAYCNKCGAYIPDGQTECLACGFDETAKNSNTSTAADAAAAFSAAAAAAAQSFSDEVRKKVAEERQRMREEEEQRRIRQENDRKWAEEEFRRRQQERQAAQTRESAARRAEAYENQTEGSYSSQRSYTPGDESAQPNKTLAALSYLSVLCFLPFIFCPNDDFAKFHAKQGLRLFVLSLFSDIMSMIPVVGAVFTLFRFYCIYKGMTNASAGRAEPLPYIGNIGRF